MHTESATSAATAHATIGREKVRAAVVVAAPGVVFGDIGTSPIYTIQTVFNPADPHPVPISPDNVFGVVSLVFWSVVIIVTLIYVTLAMRANVEHNQVRHQHVLIMSIETVPVPRVLDTVEIDDLGYAGHGIVHVSARFGYMVTPDVPRAVPARPAEGRGSDRPRPGVLLPVQDRVDEGPRPDHGSLAQAAVHRDVLHHRVRGGVLRPPAQPRGDHGIADRGLAPASREPPGILPGSAGRGSQQVGPELVRARPSSL